MSTANGPRVEVVAYVHFAANDDAVSIVAFVDGVEVPVDKVVVDPGSGHLLTDWRDARDRAAAVASPACAELINDWYETGESHVNVVDAPRPQVGVP
jgi:hypothetical protein